jgi:hypothetical protein
MTNTLVFWVYLNIAIAAPNPAGFGLKGGQMPQAFVVRLPEQSKSPKLSWGF